MPTIMAIFVQSTFVLATFVHIRNISAVTESISNQTSKVGSWDHFYKMPTVMVTFAQATFVQTAFFW